MKNILLDICLVLLILIIGNQLFDPYALRQEELNRQLEVFNQEVSNQEILDKRYRLTKDTGQNEVSHWVEEVSDFSRDGIKTVVEFLARGFNGF